MTLVLLFFVATHLKLKAFTMITTPTCTIILLALLAPPYEGVAVSFDLVHLVANTTVPRFDPWSASFPDSGAEPYPVLVSAGDAVYGTWDAGTSYDVEHVRKLSHTIPTGKTTIMRCDVWCLIYKTHSYTVLVA